MATVDLPTSPLAPGAATAQAPPAQPVQRPLQPRDFDLGILFARTLDAIVVANVDDGTIALWNPAAEALFGYPAAETVGQPLEILMADGIGHVHHAGMERYRRTGHGLIMDSGGSVEVPARTRSGDDIRIDLALSPIACSRGGRFVLGVMRDTTDRKRVELLNFEVARLQAARVEAEAARDARDDLFGRVAVDHECGRVERVGRSLEQARKLAAGALTLAPSADDLALVLKRCVVAARAKTRDHRLVLRGASCVPSSFDAARLEQVFEELLTNAIEHNPEGCLIEVQLRRVSRQLAEITVRDYGVAIAPEKRQRLFQPHYRAHPGRRAGGAGLGLHISRRLVELHGGKLDASFPATGGMRLVITLPIVEPSE